MPRMPLVIRRRAYGPGMRQTMRERLLLAEAGRRRDDQRHAVRVLHHKMFADRVQTAAFGLRRHRRREATPSAPPLAPVM